MRPVWVEPRQVPAADVRCLDTSDDLSVPVQRVDVQPVAEPQVVPRQLDGVALRLTALQRENDELREQLEQLEQRSR